MKHPSFDTRKAGRPMKRTLVVATMSLSLVSLAGCATKIREEAASGPVAGAAGAATSGAVMTVAEAGETYLKLSVAPNAAREAWMKASAPTPSNLAEHKKLATNAADASAGFAKGLRGKRWPGKAQPIVNALVAKLLEREAAYRKVAKTQTVAAYLAAAAQVPVTTSLTADLRAALGLPAGAVVVGATPS